MHIVKYNDEIFHSDIYLGEIFDSGLKHWKYIKKEKTSSGKMRYYYKNDKMDDLFEERNKAIGEAMSTHSKLNNSTKDYLNSSKLPVTIDGMKERNSIEKTYRKDLYNYAEAYDRANALITKTRKEYIKDTPRRIIGNAISFIANFFQRIRGK